MRRGFDGKFPPSLRNIINECAADLGPSKQFSKPRDKRLGDLSPWAKQGVLLLNTCLTVRKGEANSHAGRGYEQLTDAIIQAVNSRAVWALASARTFDLLVALVCEAPQFHLALHLIAGARVRLPSVGQARARKVRRHR